MGSREQFVLLRHEEGYVHIHKAWSCFWGICVLKGTTPYLESEVLRCKSGIRGLHYGHRYM